MTARSGTIADPPYRNGNVLRWVSAYATSMAGSSIYFLALAWAANDVADAAEVGLVLAAGGVPRALLMLFGGVVVDTFGPRRTMIVSDATRCLIILGVAAALFFTNPGLWILIPLAIVFGIVDAIFMPAVGAMPPYIANPGQLSRVQGMRGVGMRLGNAGGPVAAGYAVAVGGPAVAFATAGALFVLSLFFVVRVRIGHHPSRDNDGHGGKATPERGEGSGQESSPGLAVLSGLRYVRQHDLLFPLLSVAALAEIAFIGPLNIGMVLLAEERGWGAPGMGLIVGAFALGAGASGAFLAVKGRFPRAGLMTVTSLLLSAGLIATIGSVAALSAAVAAGAMLGILAGILNVLTAALIQTHTRSSYLGRVISVLTLVTVGATPLVYPVMGGAIGAWDSASVFIGCGVICALAAVTALCHAPLRHAELAPTS